MERQDGGVREDKVAQARKGIQNPRYAEGRHLDKVLDQILDEDRFQKDVRTA